MGFALCDCRTLAFHVGKRREQEERTGRGLPALVICYAAAGRLSLGRKGEGWSYLCVGDCGRDFLRICYGTGCWEWGRLRVGSVGMPSGPFNSRQLHHPRWRTEGSGWVRSPALVLSRWALWCLRTLCPLRAATHNKVPYPWWLKTAEMEERPGVQHPCWPLVEALRERGLQASLMPPWSGDTRCPLACSCASPSGLHLHRVLSHVSVCLLFSGHSPTGSGL